jgi:alpha-glucosidase
MSKFSIFILFLVAAFFNVSGQQNPVLSAGDVTSTSIETQKLTFKTTNAFGEIQVYSPNMVRVRLDKKPLAKDFSYAVVMQPQKTNVKVSQSENEIVLLTDSLKAVISKKPFAVAFFTTDGKLINQDEKGLQNSWVAEEVTAYKQMQPGERFVGLGEKNGNLDRKGNGYTNWNYDAFGYSTGQDPLYSSIPFYIGIHNRLNYGIFLDNTYQTDFNFGASNNRFSSFSAQGGELNYYFIYHTQLSDIVKSYTALTGRMKMPPLWSLGYQQNRYSYYPETEVMRIAQTLREKKIPADGITLDIHYMDQYKLFTWDKQRFGDPLAMNKKLKAMGFKTTVIVDPGIKVEDGYAAYEDGVKKNIFVKYVDSTNFTAQVWPGWCHFPDFTSPLGRNWWHEKIKFFANTGVDGIWNDMNEIASWGQKMPSNIIFNYDGALASHKQAHNVYGLQMARSSFEGMVQATNKRPFNLTRAGYAGLQRYTAIWTGDNRSEEDHMLAGVRLLNSLGLSGVAFTGMDIGGFTGNPSISLYARWIQIGAFNPYFRNHTAVNTKSSEPWAYGEEVTEISRNFINLRYKLLPYLYSTFNEAAKTGMPVVRSLAFSNTHEPKVYDGKFQNQFMFGQAFLVAPFESTKEYGAVFFPKGNWYSLYNDEQVAGDTEKILRLSLQQLPVFVKGGSIVPMQSLIQNTTEKPSDTLVLHIYRGMQNNKFVYYEDDGETYNYENGDYYQREINYDAAQRKIVFNQVDGNFKSKFTSLKLVFHGFDDKDKIQTSGSLKAELISFIDPVSRFDPQGFANPTIGCNVKTVIIANDKNRFEIKY